MPRTLARAVSGHTGVGIGLPNMNAGFAPNNGEAALMFAGKTHSPQSFHTPTMRGEDWHPTTGGHPI